MSVLKLGNRLSTATSFVRGGAVVADIGTDHAYIPIYLVSEGIVDFAIASDLNLGPIEKAKEHISAYSLEEKIVAIVANGLDGIEKYKPTDIVICGMGGELIADILSKSEYIKNPDIRLILQPMTCQKELREYLSNGFSIIDEAITLDTGKLYQVICAHYDGKKHSFTNAEYELGPKNIEKRETLFDKLLLSAIAKKKKRLDGLLVGGYDTTEIQNEIKEMEDLYDI